MEEPTKALPSGEVDTTGWTVLEGAPKPVSKPPVVAPPRLSIPVLINTRKPIKVVAIAVSAFVLLLGVFYVRPHGGSCSALSGQAHQHILGILKAPSTAKFGPDTTVQRLNDGSCYLEGTVDAQNSFGAMLRGEWYVDFSDGAMAVCVPSFRAFKESAGESAECSDGKFSLR